MSVLDLDVLTGLERDLGDRDLVREVVQLYLIHLPERQRAVADAAEAGDLSALQREAHALGSASAMVGATLLRLLCRDLESRPAGSAITASDPLLMAWPATCAETRNALDAWLAAA